MEFSKWLQCFLSNSFKVSHLFKTWIVSWSTIESNMIAIWCFSFPVLFLRWGEPRSTSRENVISYESVVLFIEPNWWTSGFDILIKNFCYPITHVREEEYMFLKIWTYLNRNLFSFCIDNLSPSWFCRFVYSETLNPLRLGYTMDKVRIIDCEIIRECYFFGYSVFRRSMMAHSSLEEIWYSIHNLLTITWLKYRGVLRMDKKNPRVRLISG